MSEIKVFHCQGCGEILDVNINQSYAICKYCGVKNLIKQEEEYDYEKLPVVIEYNIDTENYMEADKLIKEAILLGVASSEIYISKARMELKEGRDKLLFETLSTLKNSKISDGEGKFSSHIKKLMCDRNRAGLTLLHLAAFYEEIDFVKFCVENGADVNSRGGFSDFTPLTILYVAPKAQARNLYGAPLVRDVQKVSEIRNYLLSHGAVDSMSDYKRLNKSHGIRKAPKKAFCIMALAGGLLGIHKFYSLKIFSGLFYLALTIGSIYLGYFPFISMALSLLDLVIALFKKPDALDYIVVNDGLNTNQ